MVTWKGLGTGWICARLGSIAPLLAPSNLPYRKPEDRELFLSGLRIAVGKAE
jgi:hypothetical protein